MTLSPDGCLLASFSNTGTVHIWDMDTFKLVQILRDQAEDNIDEYYVGQFHPNGTKLAVGGKLKDRRLWSKEDDDNHIMACPIKVSFSK
jgi:WD40 repeat protein